MLILSSQELNIVQKILQRHVPKYSVWAFGSRVKGTTKKTADLDLAVITKNGLSVAEKVGLTDDFDESSLPFKVDIVDWANTSPEFRKIIAEKKVVIQDPSASVR